MAEIKWIKITTDMFEDEKIDYISSLPDGDTVILIWVRLLLLAGKANASGWVMLTENIPYDDAMIANKFRKPINTIRYAIETFVRLGMIEYGHAILVSNWEKHQNIDGLEKIKEQNKKRKQNERERKKNHLLVESRDMSRDVTAKVTASHAIEGEEEIELDLISPTAINNVDDESETVHEVHLKVFNTPMMSGMMAEYVTQLMKAGLSEEFIKEAMREAGESSAKPNLKYFKSISESWREKGISSRAEAKLNLEYQKQAGGDSRVKSQTSNDRTRPGRNKGTSAKTQGESVAHPSKWDV